MVEDDEDDTELSKYEVKPFTKIYKLVNSNATRWNSVLAMITRLLTLKDAVKAWQVHACRDTTVARKLRDMCLTDEDFLELEVGALLSILLSQN